MQRNLLISIIFVWSCFGPSGNSAPFLRKGVGVERGCASKDADFSGGNESGFRSGNESGFPGGNYDKENPYSCIGAIPAPEGYHREAAEMNPFAQWLRAKPGGKDVTQKKRNLGPAWEKSLPAVEETWFLMVNLKVIPRIVYILRRISLQGRFAFSTLVPSNFLIKPIIK